MNEFKKEQEREGAASNTIRLDLALISSLYTIARKEWNLAYLQNPIADMRMPKAGKPRNGFLSAEERTRLVSALKECRNPLVPIVAQSALETAARQGEILDLLRVTLI
jgi:integrase